MDIHIEVVTSFEQLQKHFELYIPLRMDYFIWSFETRKKENPKVWESSFSGNSTLDDLIKAYQMQKDANQLNSETIELIKNRYENGMWTALLYANQELAGTARLTVRNETECELHSVFVYSKWRGKGFGGLMLDKLIQVGKEQGFELMLLRTLPFMTSAIKVYESRGFQKTGYIQFNDDTEEESRLRENIFMKKQL